MNSIIQKGNIMTDLDDISNTNLTSLRSISHCVSDISSQIQQEAHISLIFCAVKVALFHLAELSRRKVDSTLTNS